MIDRHESRCQEPSSSPPARVAVVAQDLFPKPLKAVAGVALLVRVLRTLQGEGIREAVIVIGYRGDSDSQGALAEPSLGLKLYFVENDRFDRKNGVSLLAAKKYMIASASCRWPITSTLRRPFVAS